jgi:uncharacterized protein DUF3291
MTSTPGPRLRRALSGESDSGNATDMRVSEDPNFLVNMSVWATIESLFDFVYRSAHRGDVDSS